MKKWEKDVAEKIRKRAIDIENQVGNSRIGKAKYDRVYKDICSEKLSKY